jgi:hypothetical protein
MSDNGCLHLSPPTTDHKVRELEARMELNRAAMLKLTEALRLLNEECRRVNERLEALEIKTGMKVLF